MAEILATDPGLGPEQAAYPAESAAPLALSAGGGVLTVDLTGWRRHGYAQVEFYSDSAGTPADPTAGTETVVLTPHGVALTSGYGLATIDDQGGWTSGVLNHAAVEPQGFRWAWPMQRVKVTLASIAGATHARLRVLAVN